MLVHEKCECFVMQVLYVCVLCVSCVHHVEVLNTAFCMTCSLLMLDEDAKGDHMELQVMQNAAFRTATGYTQDTNIQHLHDETLILPIHEHLDLSRHHPPL